MSANEHMQGPEDEAIDSLTATAARLLAERAKDVEPHVAAIAVRGLRQTGLATVLSDVDFAVVASLCLSAPETHTSLRLESALFVACICLKGFFIIVSTNPSDYLLAMPVSSWDCWSWDSETTSGMLRNRQRKKGLNSVDRLAEEVLS